MKTTQTTGQNNNSWQLRQCISHERNAIVYNTEHDGSIRLTSTFSSGVAGSALDSSIRAVPQNTVKFIAAAGLIGQSGGRGEIGECNALNINIQRASPLTVGP